MGKDLGKAASQAYEYIQNLISEKRSDEVPRYIAVSDRYKIRRDSRRDAQKNYTKHYHWFELKTDPYSPALRPPNRHTHLKVF